MSGKRYPLHPCEAGCGTQTRNQRFCSYTCASGSQKKRQGEGICPACGGAMRTRQQQCDACEAQGIDGRDFQEAPAAPVVVKPTFFFPEAGSALFTLRDTCGELLAHVIDVLERNALPYLTELTRRRHLALLKVFRDYEMETLGGQARVRVSVLRLESLALALQRWFLEESARDAAHALWSSYVLDTAHFLLALADGGDVPAYGQELAAKLPPLVCDFERTPECGIADAMAKKRITQRIDGIIAEVTLPSGVSLRAHRPERAPLHDRERIYVLLQRCHASSRHFYEASALDVVDEAGPRFDMALSFGFECLLIPDELMARVLLREPGPEGYPRQCVTIPGDWISALMTPVRTFEPVPSWS